MSDFSFSVCTQCGFSHPPLNPGAKCPMAKEKTETGKEINFDQFFISLKNILTNQIQQKKIEDVSKFFGNILVKINSFTEDYKE